LARKIPFEKISSLIYTLPASEAAWHLIGKLFFKRTEDGISGGVITETEAYEQNDPASHSYRGETERNKVMFGPGGFLYVYFVYGKHHCANVVTGKPGSGEAVLIRSIAPLYGIEYMQKNRNRSDVKADDLLTGPGNVCKGLAISREDNGTDLRGDKIMLLEPNFKLKYEIRTSTRIGIKKATERPWRFTFHLIRDTN
jgi:DNA-3-methyladenine glycosylase